MKKRLLSFILILCMLIGLIPSAMAADHPIRLTAEPDPDCSLSEAGTLSFVRFVIRNTGSSEYTMYRPSLSSKVLEEAFHLSDGNGEGEFVTMEPGAAQEFSLYDIYLPESALNRDIKFTLSWQEAVNEEPDEPEEEEDGGDIPQPDEDPYPEEEQDETEDPYLPEEPLEEEPEENVMQLQSASRGTRFVERSVSTTICIETSDVPVMTLNVKADRSPVRTDGEVTVKYVLTNPTKFDFEDIVLKDPSAGGKIELEDTTLQAGESVTVLHQFTMGRESVELCPEATYSVRGKTQKAKCSKPVTVECMYVSLALDVQQYSATEDGSVFAFNVTNTGTHRMRGIELTDDIGMRLCDTFSLEPGRSRSLTYTYGSYTGLSENRHVSFSLRATDAEGESYIYQKRGSYEVRPYIESGQVSLLMNVTLTDYFEDKNTVELLFEIRNYSGVAITDAVITESESFRGTVQSYPSLSRGVTTFSKEFTLGPDISTLTFHMEADDAGGTHYATEPVSLHVDQLALSVKNGTFGGASNTVIDTSNTVFDTDKYSSFIKTGIACILLAAVVCMLISILFRGAENYIRKTLPAPEPSSRVTGAGGAVQDTARLRFGYVKPAKLRYAEEESFAEKKSTGSLRNTAAGREMNYETDSKQSAGTRASQKTASVKLISTGTFQKPRKQIKMLTTEDTLVFQAPAVPKKKPAAGTQDKVNTLSSEPGKKEFVRERVIRAVPETETTKNEAPEPGTEKKKTPEKRLSMSECLRAGRPYTFEIEPPPAVIPAAESPEIVIIAPRHPLA